MSDFPVEGTMFKDDDLDQHTPYVEVLPDAR